MIGGCKSCSLVLRYVIEEPVYYWVLAELLPRGQWLLELFRES